MESSNTKNLRHLYDLTHAVPEVPALGSAYALKLVETFNAKGHTLPPQISERAKYCSHCNTVSVPGVNSSMRMVFAKKPRRKCQRVAFNSKKPWSPRERYLRFSCFACNGVTDHKVLIPNAPQNEDYRQKPTFVAKWEPNTKDGTKVVMESRKRKKKNNLMSLLNDKKEAEDKERKKSSLLSLDDFMQS